MSTLDTIHASLASRINAFAGLHLEMEPSGTPLDQSKVVMPASDLFALAGLLDLAQTAVLAAAEINSVRYPVATTTDETPTDQREKWAEAGRKSWETRRRNEAAKVKAGKRR